MKHLLLILMNLGAALSYPTVWAQVPESLDYTILQQKKHNPDFFTQGLILHNNKIIETSGLYGKSFISEYNIDSNVESKRVQLPRSIFAEGLTLFDNQLYMLSWRSHTAFVLDPMNFGFVKSFQYKGEGWGITHNHAHLITSNGSAKLTFRNPSTFTPIKTITVHDDTRQYSNINELEFAQGLIWANVWQSSTILAIDPNTGQVKGMLNLHKLAKQNHTIPEVSVLNGIAYDKELGAFWVTGKLWPMRYLIQPKWHHKDRNSTPDSSTATQKTE